MTGSMSGFVVRPSSYSASAGAVSRITDRATQPLKRGSVLTQPSIGGFIISNHYLVTGGCGFIGSHLCDALLTAGHSVTVLDDLSSGIEANLPPAANLILGSICDEAIVARAVDGIDGCFHLAAIASVERSVRDWAATHRVNLGGTVSLLDRIARNGAVPFVYASSAAVYGASGDLPLREDGRVAPVSAYGADKYACELHAHVATHTHAIPTTGLRFFNVYGPRQDPRSPYSGVLSIFAERLAIGRSVCIFGDGEQTRDFVYVADVVRAMMAAMVHPSPTPRVFNVCTGTATSVLDLARAAAEVCGTHLAVEHGPARSAEVRHSVGDTTALTAALCVTAQTPLPAGVHAVVDWLRTVSK